MREEGEAEEGEKGERFLTLETPGTPADPADFQSESPVRIGFSYIFLRKKVSSFIAPQRQ